MHSRTIQAGPLALDQIILGTSQFGTGYSVEESFAQLDAYFALGGRTLDTAAIYGDWEDLGTPVSEQTIGRWMRERGNRDQLKVITKGCHYRLSTPDVSRVGAEDIHTDVARSLEALGTDYIDLYLLHRDNPSVPVEEIVDALAVHVQKGELRAVGASNWTVDRILEANRYARDRGLPCFVASEIQWSLAVVEPEKDDLPGLPKMTAKDCRRYADSGLAVLAWSSQGGGVIAKLLEREDYVPAGKFASHTTLQRAQRVKALAGETGYTPTQICLAYLLCGAVKAAAVVGASRPEQIAEAMKALDIALTQEQRAFLKS